MGDTPWRCFRSEPAQRSCFFSGCDFSLVRFLPAYKDNEPPGNCNPDAGNRCVLRLRSRQLASSLAFAACMLPAAAEMRSMIGLGWLLLAAQALFDLCNEYSRARGFSPWRYMALQVSRSFSAVLLGCRSGAAGNEVARAASGSWRSGCCSRLHGAWRNDWLHVRLSIDRSILAKLCQYGMPLSLTVALTIVIGSSDRFLIAFFRGEESAGIYSAAVDFTSQTLTLLMMVIQLAMFPIAVRAFEQHGKQAAQGQMRTNVSLLMAVGAPCVVGIALLSSGIANCFLGKEFRGAAAGIMPLIALGTFLAGLKAYHFDTAFQFAHRTVHQVWIVLAAAAINIGLNLVAIPRFGINGSAVASLLAYLFSILLTVHVGRKYFALPFPIEAGAKVLAACGAMALVIYPLRGYQGTPALAIQIGAGAAVYGVVLVACNFLALRQPALNRFARWCACGDRQNGAFRRRASVRDGPLAATLAARFQWNELRCEIAR